MISGPGGDPGVSEQGHQAVLHRNVAVQVVVDRLAFLDKLLKPGNTVYDGIGHGVDVFKREISFSGDKQETIE